MKVKSLLFALAFALVLSSCAFHGGSYVSSANINRGNFKIVKNVSGQSRTLKVFGIGGLSKDALVAEARANLALKYPLEPNQILANVSVDSKNSFLLIVGINRVTITGDIIEFVDE